MLVDDPALQIKREVSFVISDIDKCPFCGGDEFIVGIQQGYAAVHGEGMFTMGSLKHVICTTCGVVVQSYVDDPEKLLKLKKRKPKY